jgi:hypothetical protein
MIGEPSFPAKLMTAFCPDNESTFTFMPWLKAIG